jgi:hypothetical protein
VAFFMAVGPVGAEQCHPWETLRDWVSDDPAGQDLDHVRHIRDQIRRRVRNLIAELTSARSVITQLVTHAGEEQAPPNGSICTERTSTQTSKAAAQRAGRWPRN